MRLLLSLALLLCLCAGARATPILGTWVSHDGFPLAGATIDINAEADIVAGATLTGTYHPVTGENAGNYSPLTAATRSAFLLNQCTFSATTTFGTSPVVLQFTGTVTCDAAGANCDATTLNVVQTVGVGPPTSFSNPFVKVN
jgi:hypothetical protein